jgi:mannose-6-phosphate isomerase
MAIALTPFLAFLNFLPLSSISAHLASVPELSSIVPSSLYSALSSSLSSSSSASAEQKDVLQKIFGAFMTLPPATVSTVIRSILARFDAGDIRETEQLQLQEQGGKEGFVRLVRMLNEQYPDDVGVLCVYLLNVVELKKGEAAFLGANMPHAYISGGRSFSFEMEGLRTKGPGVYVGE